MLTVNSTLHNEQKETQYIHFFKYFNFVLEDVIQLFYQLTSTSLKNGLSLQKPAKSTLANLNWPVSVPVTYGKLHGHFLHLLQRHKLSKVKSGIKMSYLIHLGKNTFFWWESSSKTINCTVFKQYLVLDPTDCRSQLSTNPDQRQASLMGPVQTGFAKLNRFSW